LYYPHFGLKEPPFKITPNTDFFFSGGNRGAVLDALVYAITNGEGIIKVVGEVGSGKTMLCRMLQAILPEKIESIYLANPSVAPEDVLHAIAFELQLKLPKNADRLKVMQQLQAHLLSRHAEGRQVVIFVEEAQGMPLATLEEIRLLSNLETKQDKLLQIVLFGQPELDVNLNQAHIRQLRERITHSFHLGPLQTKDVGEYLIFRLRAAGYFGPHLFTDAAIKKLSNAAEGLVRRVNVLADKCLLAAFADNVHQVTPKHVKVAIQDSEFGAKPTNYKQYFLLAAILIALLTVALGYFWWQIQHQPKYKVEANKASVYKPASDISKTLPAQQAMSTSKGYTDNITKPIKQPVDVKQLLLDKRLEVSKNWLLKEPPATITLQIKSLPSKNPVKDEALITEIDSLSQQLEIDNIYLYRKKQNGELYTVILYGSFGERNEALATLRNLPSQIKNDRPYLRTLAGINKDIEQAQ
jgi:MSHA biogenesis protein MshM